MSRKNILRKIFLWRARLIAEETLTRKYFMSGKKYSEENIFLWRARFIANKILSRKYLMWRGRLILKEILNRKYMFVKKKIYK